MEKKIYELTVAMSDKKTEKELKTLVVAALEKVGGREVEFKFWGKKDLVYPIKKQGTVIYGYFEVELPANKVADMATRLRMNDDVLRHLMVLAPEVKSQKLVVSAKAKKFAKIAVKKTAEAKAKAEVKEETKKPTDTAGKVTNKKK